MGGKTKAPEVRQETKQEMGPEQKQIFDMAFPYLQQYASTPVQQFQGSGITPLNTTMWFQFSVVRSGSVVWIKRAKPIVQDGSHGASFVPIQFVLNASAGIPVPHVGRNVRPLSRISFG